MRMNFFKRESSSSRMAEVREILRFLAGEGGYAIYRRSALFDRFLILLQFLNVILSSAIFGSVSGCLPTQLAYVKGANQLRLYKRARSLLNRHGYHPVLRVQPDLRWRGGVSRDARWPRLFCKDVIKLLCPITAYLFLGKKRYLNLFFLNYFRRIHARLVDAGGANVETLVTFNDQQFEAAAVILSIKKLSGAKTITLQHGIIVSPRFYFPSLSDEFWAWGEAVREHFCAYNTSAKLVIVGRFLDDYKTYRRSPCAIANPPSLQMLVVPSHKHREILCLTKTAAKIRNSMGGFAQIAIKLHPNTKFKFAVRSIALLSALHCEYDSADISDLAGSYDVILTKNSTSAVDFVLRGKIVFVSCTGLLPDFLSENIAFMIEDGRLDWGMLREKILSSVYAEYRHSFLRNILNV